MVIQPRRIKETIWRFHLSQNECGNFDSLGKYL